MKKRIIVITLLSLIPTISFANGFVFANPLGSQNMDLFVLLNRVIDFILKIASVFIVVMIIYSGFLFIKAQGKPAEIEKAKSVFFWAVVGALIILGARVISSIVCNTASSLGANLGNLCR